MERSSSNLCRCTCAMGYMWTELILYKQHKLNYTSVLVIVHVLVYGYIVYCLIAEVSHDTHHVHFLLWCHCPYKVYSPLCGCSHRKAVTAVTIWSLCQGTCKASRDHLYYSMVYTYMPPLNGQTDLCVMKGLICLHFQNFEHHCVRLCNSHSSLRHAYAHF